MEFTLNKVRLPDLSMVIIVARDISDRKELELSIENYNVQLEQKVEERTQELILANSQKDKLFSIVSHDLRGPFNPIVGYAQMMVDNESELTLEQAHKYSRRILDSSKNYMYFLDALLEWSTLQLDGINIVSKKYDLLSIVESVLNVVAESAIEKNIRIDNSIETKDFILDKNVVATVLRNLITNAIKFTQNGGQISLDSHFKDDKCVIRVSDTGIGISKEHIKEIMSKEENISRIGTNAEKGTGLGLSICMGLLEKHGGDLSVSSKEGDGTVFTVKIPQ